jgi:hypothetical protein
MDGVMQALAKKKTQWNEDLLLTVKLARQKLSKYYVEVTPTTGMHLISAQILNPFQKLRSIRKWGKGMHNNPEDETYYTAQYRKAYLKDLENKSCANHRRARVNKLESVPSCHFVHSRTGSGSYQSSFDTYDLPSDDEKYLTPNSLAE